MDLATFGAGCFWGVQAAFNPLAGVEKTTVGYMGGSSTNPTYEQVCTDKTGHVEVIQIQYNEKIISYKQLLEVFWKIHDPTQRNRQGLDVGTQYQSVIFYHSKKQHEIALQSADNQQKKYTKEIATVIREAKPFYPAEKYHQNYLEKQGLSGCHL
ncbi:MAG: peptide-methionine (S)-S-oxide reductase MsrA [Thermoplasmatota archaeon]